MSPLLLLLAFVVSTEGVNVHKKLQSRIRARLESSESAAGFLETLAQSSLSCDKKCASKCEASDDCKDDSCNHDYKACKANSACMWKDAHQHCKEGHPSYSPTTAPTPFPTTSSPITQSPSASPTSRKT